MAGNEGLSAAITITVADDGGADDGGVAVGSTDPSAGDDGYGLDAARGGADSCACTTERQGIGSVFGMLMMVSFGPRRRQRSRESAAATRFRPGG